MTGSTSCPPHRRRHAGKGGHPQGIGPAGLWRSAAQQRGPDRVRAATGAATARGRHAVNTRPQRCRLLAYVATAAPIPPLSTVQPARCWTGRQVRRPRIRRRFAMDPGAPGSLAAKHGHRFSSSIFSAAAGLPNALQTELQGSYLFVFTHDWKITHVENQYAARALC